MSLNYACVMPKLKIIFVYFWFPTSLLGHWFASMADSIFFFKICHIFHRTEKQINDNSVMSMPIQILNKVWTVHPFYDILFTPLICNTILKDIYQFRNSLPWDRVSWIHEGGRTSTPANLLIFKLSFCVLCIVLSLSRIEKNTLLVF